MPKQNTFRDTFHPWGQRCKWRLYWQCRCEGTHVARNAKNAAQHLKATQNNWSWNPSSSNPKGNWIEANWKAFEKQAGCIYLKDYQSFRSKTAISGYRSPIGNAHMYPGPSFWQNSAKITRFFWDARSLAQPASTGSWARWFPKGVRRLSGNACAHSTSYFYCIGRLVAGTAPSLVIQLPRLANTRTVPQP